MKQRSCTSSLPHLSPTLTLLQGIATAHVPYDHGLKIAQGRSDVIPSYGVPYRPSCPVASDFRRTPLAYVPCSQTPPACLIGLRPLTWYPTTLLRRILRRVCASPSPAPHFTYPEISLSLHNALLGTTPGQATVRPALEGDV